jgi:hypothetical protein
MYTQPYIDIDEWRDAPVRHRYVHGGFKDTDCRFSMYFPPNEKFEGRFFHPITPISGRENAAQADQNTENLMMGDAIGFASASGGYLIESNLGRMDMFPGEDPTIVGYRASAAVAEYSRVVASEMYGSGRIYGYVYGGSGGAFKTISCIENTKDVWDGAVPFVHASPMAMPNFFTVQFHAQRLLKAKFPMIVDALEPGGSGDMYSGLSDDEAAALKEATRMGFPPRTWFNHARIAFGYTGVFAAILDSLVKWDPEYFTDFWTVPGYLGADRPESLAAARFKHDTRIAKVVMSDEVAAMGLPMSMSGRFGHGNTPVPAALRLERVPKKDLTGATVTVKSGDAEGACLLIAGVIGDLAMIGFGATTLAAVGKIRPGDAIQLDNDRYLATQTYHRHQMPGPDYPGWDQFRGKDGKPLYPQRPEILGPRFAYDAAGSLQSGKINCKTIVVQCLMDEAAFAAQADWYREKVKTALGPHFEDNYRLWFVDHGLHTSPQVAPGEPPPVITTRVTAYVGALQQALRDLAAWVEEGIAPPASTSYRLEDGQVIVPDSAADRRGVQPVARLSANGGARADVRAGEVVEFVGVAKVPPGTGKIVVAEWDFEGAGDYPVSEDFTVAAAPQEMVTMKRTYAFAKPGTYFPTLRVASHRNGEVSDKYGKVLNLARVRVVVT